MSQDKKDISLRSAISLAVIFLGIIIIKLIFTNEENLYWLLILLIPLMYFLLLYFKKIRYHRFSKVRKSIADYGRIRSDKHTFNLNKSEDTGLKVLIGNSHCSRPYLSGIIENEVIEMYKNTDEIIENGNDFESSEIWQIVPGYYGCRSKNYNFDPELFRLKALEPCVKMIELKLVMSSKENFIPIKKSVQANAILNYEYRGLNAETISRHTAFSNTESMVIFLDSLRQLSDSKPVGIRFCIKNKKDKKEFQEICYVFRKTGIIPDCVIIEGCENKSNVLSDFPQSQYISLYDGLLFISKTLEMYGLNKQIKIIVSTSIYTAFDVLKLYALGAHAIRMQNFIISDINKNASSDAGDLRSKIIRNMKEIMKVCGYASIHEITLSSLLQKFDFLHPNNQKVRIDIQRTSLHSVRKIS